MLRDVREPPQTARKACSGQLAFITMVGMQLKLSIVPLLWLVGAASVFAGDGDSPEGVAYFETHIRPLLVEHCYQCHSTKSGLSEGELRLDSREAWTTGGDRGPAVVPGKLSSSLLIQAVRYSDDLQMPPDEPLPPQAIERLEHWIRLGAPAPDDDQLSMPGHDDPSDPVAGKDHWAFRRFDDRLPVSANSPWARTDIDRYIWRSLREANLWPAPDADRRDLARRVYIQLTGLAPTADQIRSFADDDHPQALERLVDRLLSQPQFGEHWGRHWLDLARYADSNGLDENFLFREAWRYRNWVIAAINADTSYDRFLLEQIAGDLLPHDSIDQRDQQRIAAGFLVVGPKVLLGNDPKRQRMEVADEQIDTIGRAILGQSLGCARCHDHKFDPFPTADYYALAGILTSTEVMERRHMLNQQRVMERLVGLGPDGDELDAAYEKYWREHKALRERRNRVKSALDLLKKDDAEGLANLIKKHADAVATEAADQERSKEGRVAAQAGLLAELDRTLANPIKIPPRAMIPVDVESPEDEHIRLAGQFDRIGDRVPRGMLQVLLESEIAISEGTSGRLELSQWLTDEHRGAGRLTARVLANRVWHHLVGRGIVRTVDNFGRTGEAPSHPQLLDHLALELIESGWSIKHLVRSIVLSHTFAISSAHDPAGHEIDPDNRLLWRANRRRLGPESLRDSMLAAAGGLDLTPLGSSVWYLGDQATAVGANKVRRRTDFPCRSVYLPVIRNDLPELFEAFDFADPHITTGMRGQTADSLQGLFLLNDDLVMDAAEAIAKRLTDLGDSDLETKVDKMCELILGSPPSDNDREALTQFVRQTQQRLRQQEQAEAEAQAWAITCHALFASSRFQIVE